MPKPSLPTSIICVLSFLFVSGCRSQAFRDDLTELREDIYSLQQEIHALKFSLHSPRDIGRISSNAELDGFLFTPINLFERNLDNSVFMSDDARAIGHLNTFLTSDYMSLLGKEPHHAGAINEPSPE